MGLLVLAGLVWLALPKRAPNPRRMKRRNPAPIRATRAQVRMEWRAHKAAQRAGVCPPGRQAHHPNYNRPLDVECLTPRQHRELHERLGKPWRRFRPGARSEGPTRTPRHATKLQVHEDLPW